jgi:pyruvate/2-oxoglutarate dehydrogenase complex dihydrolipoamide acyltransferase (E2) component
MSEALGSPRVGASEEAGHGTEAPIVDDRVRSSGHDRQAWFRRRRAVHVALKGPPPSSSLSPNTGRRDARGGVLPLTAVRARRRFTVVDGEDRSVRRTSRARATDRIPLERLATVEVMPILALRNRMHAFVEVDVTEARARLRAQRERTGERRSFTAFVVCCLARAVDEHREVQTFRRGRRLIASDTVDVATLIEVVADGDAIPLPYVVRDAAHRSYETIHRQLRSAQRDGRLVTEYRRRARPLRFVPRPLRWVGWQAFARATRLRMRLGGTVVVTSVGSVGAARGWGLAESGYPATVTVGGISRQPVLINGQLVEREWLRLTVSLDHDVVDGAPAARFVDRLCQLLEQAHGLEEDVRGPGAGGEPLPEPGGGPTRGAAPPAIRWNPTPGAE